MLIISTLCNVLSLKNIFLITMWSLSWTQHFSHNFCKHRIYSKYDLCLLGAQICSCEGVPPKTSRLYFWKDSLKLIYEHRKCLRYKYFSFETGTWESWSVILYSTEFQMFFAVKTNLHEIEYLKFPRMTIATSPLGNTTDR